MKKIITSLASAALLFSTTPVMAQTEETAETQDNFSVVMVSSAENFRGDSFVSIALEGLYKYGADNYMETGPGGFEFKPNMNDAAFFSAFQQAIDEDYELIIGLGDLTTEPLEEFASTFPDRSFLLVDATSELENVASATFKDYEAAYLAGIAAASETASNHIGFIGGMDIENINNFEKGFVAGATEVNPDIVIETEYLENFDDEPGAYDAAKAMYAGDTDIIYHAAGAAGYGVFEAARDQKIENPDKGIYVIGADYDQTEEGQFEVDGNEYSLTLTSTLKHVDTVVYELVELAANGELEAQEYEYGMENGGVDIAEGQLSGETLDLIADYRDQMQSGELDVSEIVFGNE